MKSLNYCNTIAKVCHAVNESLQVLLVQVLHSISDLTFSGNHPFHKEYFQRYPFLKCVFVLTNLKILHSRAICRIYSIQNSTSVIFISRHSTFSHIFCVCLYRIYEANILPSLFYMTLSVNQKP